MNLKSLFKKHEYQIGMGFYNIWDTKSFDTQTYYMVLFVSYFGYAIAMLFFCMVLVFIYNKESLWLLFQYIFNAVFTVCILRNSESSQVAIDLHKKLRKVPNKIKENAKILYSKEWRESAIECHEGHVYGDCPLCGAE